MSMKRMSMKRMSMKRMSIMRIGMKGMSMMRMIRGFLDRCPIPTINAKHPLNYDFGII
jgi:hypothetical protein